MNRQALELIDQYAEHATLAINRAELGATGLVSRRLTSANPTLRIERLRMLNGLEDVNHSLLTAFERGSDWITDIESLALGAVAKDLGLMRENVAGSQDQSDARQAVARNAVLEVSNAINRVGLVFDQQLMSRVAVLQGVMGVDAAVEKAKVEFLLKPLSFDVRDTAQRKWELPRYFAASMRSFALKTYVETYIQAATQRGISEFAIYHEDAEHQTNDIVFNIQVDPMATVFHPNFRGLPVAVPNVHS